MSHPDPSAPIGATDTDTAQKSHKSQTTVRLQADSGTQPLAAQPANSDPADPTDRYDPIGTPPQAAPQTIAGQSNMGAPAEFSQQPQSPTTSSWHATYSGGQQGSPLVNSAPTKSAAAAQDPVRATDSVQKFGGQEAWSQNAADHNIQFEPEARPATKLMHLAPKAKSRLQMDIVDGRRSSTIEDYDRRVRALFKVSSAARTLDPQIPIDASPLEVVEDFIASVAPPQSRGANSWRVCRAALLWFLNPRREKHPIYEEAYAKLAQAKYQTLARASGDDSSPVKRRRKAKLAISQSDLRVLLNSLAHSITDRTVVGSDVQIWLQAGIACGARIIEWTGVFWADRQKCLLSIPNAKLKAAKPAMHQLHGSQGTGITVHDLPPADGDYSDLRSKSRLVRVDPAEAIYIDLQLTAMWAAIVAHQAEGLSTDEAFDRYYHRCRRTLSTACRTAFGGRKSYSLRVTRSQFAANAKAEFALGSVAEMMGHSSVRTTMGNYGPRARAHKGPDSDSYKHSDAQQGYQGHHADSGYSGQSGPSDGSGSSSADIAS